MKNCPACGGPVGDPRLLWPIGLAGPAPVLCTDPFHGRKPSERCGGKPGKPGLVGHGIVSVGFPYPCPGCEDCKPVDKRRPEGRKS